MISIKKIVLFGYTLSLLIIITLGLGVTTGIKGAITWGPTNDFWAISIALSKIEYGLNGYLGYKEVSQKLANDLSSTKSDTNVGDLETRDLVQIPELITAAIIKAAQLDKSSLKDGDKWSGHYLSYSEDIGFIDYYRIAFSIFGYNAYSGYNLYILFYVFSLIVLYLRYRSNTACMISALFISLSIFAAANSLLMSDLMISIGSNRFISTLVFIPLLHIIYEGSLTVKKGIIFRNTLLLIQVSLIYFIITIRISAQWAILFILFIMLFKIFLIYFKNIKYGLKRVLSYKAANYSYLVLMVIFLGFSYRMIQNFNVDKIYHSQDMMPHHLVWHSAFIGLNQHPKWNDNLPYKNLYGAGGDSIPFIVTNNVLEGSGISIVGGAGGSGGTKNRLHDEIIKKEFFKFLYNNPKYSLELYLIHKPMAMLSVLQSQYQGTKIYIHYLTFICLLFSLLMLLKSNKSQFIATSIALTSFFISVFSTLPILWAYPAPFVLADQYVAFYNLALSLILFSIYLIFYLFTNFRFGFDIKFFRKFIAIVRISDMDFLNGLNKKIILHLEKKNII